MSLGQDTSDAAFQVRDETIPGAARSSRPAAASRGRSQAEPTAPYWVTTEAEARKAVQEQAARKVDIIKIWVDDRDGKFKKLTPELYGAVIDEAHKHGLRVTAHIFTLEDAKGLLRAGLDAFAHSVRDKDVDEEFMALMKTAADLVLVPEPARSRRRGRPELAAATASRRRSCKKLQAGGTDRPEAQKAFGDPGAQPGEDERRRRTDRARHGRQHAWRRTSRWPTWSPPA